ncbi:MAG: hypothetical protein AAGI44_14585 [Pseudomonadota bacterium]
MKHLENPALKITLTLLLLLAPQPILAIPFTFKFELPAFEQNEDPVLFGNSAILQLTVDNGSSDIKSQTYLNAEIIRAAVSVIGGSYFNAWTNADVQDIVPSGTSFVSTDASGIPLLNLMMVSEPQAIRFNKPSGSLQLGRLTNTPFIISTGPFFSDDRALLASSFSVVGARVPVSATCWLLTIGILILGTKRKRSVKVAPVRHVEMKSI